MHRMATRVTLPASRFAPVQEARHGQPSVIADVGQNYMYFKKVPILLLISAFIGINLIADDGNLTVHLEGIGFKLIEKSQKWKYDNSDELSHQVEINVTILEREVFPVHMKHALAYERALLRPLGLKTTSIPAHDWFEESDSYFAEVQGQRDYDNLIVTVMIYGENKRIRSIRVRSYTDDIDLHHTLVEKLKAQSGPRD